MNRKTQIKSSAPFSFRRHREKGFHVYLFIIITILLFWSLPKGVCEKIRSSFVFLHQNLFALHSDTSRNTSLQEAQILFLRDQVRGLEERLRAYETAQGSLKIFPQILTPYFQNVTSARVVYRDPSYWGSSCWVNVGKKEGVQKNAPVLSGNVLVGLIDYVGETQSRVRLITDMGMQPSVIVFRGDVDVGLVRERARELISSLYRLSEDSLSTQDRSGYIQWLEGLISSIQGKGEYQTSLRGVLSGNGGPLWKKESQILFGDGFCFSEGQNISVGDILVTTGLDGVCPPGLFVAEVTKVNTPLEGACSYKLEARSLAGDLPHLSSVLILPAMAFNPNDRPDIFGLLWD